MNKIFKARVVTFGILPDSPACRYIGTENLTKKSSIEGLDINAFIEKPDRKKSKYKDKDFYGIIRYLFKTNEIIRRDKEIFTKDIHLF